MVKSCLYVKIIISPKERIEVWNIEMLGNTAAQKDTSFYELLFNDKPSFQKEKERI